MELQLFTSESVSPGHPDKICDQISDAILDACLAVDPNARVACECFITTNRLVIGGEITVNGQVDYEAIARKVISEIGYNDESIGMDAKTCQIDVLIDSQSVDIAQGVNQSNEALGAGDQGIMFGYATNETSNYMPLAITIAHDLVQRATELMKDGSFKNARPDMKSQVTIDMDDLSIHTILLSIQHDDHYDEKQFKEYIRNEIIQPVIKPYKIQEDAKILINPTGRFVIGGPHGDTGLTGRKIIVDTYGGSARHGGGAFSGKDATKVDRSAAYMARYLAKNIVAAKLADRCEIQLSYAIGVKHPISVLVDTFNTGKVDDEILHSMIRELVDLTPRGIIETLQLNQPIFKNTAAYGHFGRKDVLLPWEELDLVDSFKQYIENK